MSTAGRFAVPPDGLDVEIVRDEGRLLELRAEWDGLWSEDGRADLFASFDWFCALHAHFGHVPSAAALAYHDGSDRQPIAGGPWSLRVCVVRDAQGRALALLPLVRVEGFFLGQSRQLLSLPINSQAIRSGISSTRFDAAVAKAIAKALNALPCWDVLIFDGLPALHADLPVLERQLRAAGSVCTMSSHWPGACMRREDTLLQHFAGAERSHFRRSLVKATNGLQKAGSLRVQCYGADRVDEGLALFMQVDALSWKAKSGESVAHHPVLHAFYSDLCHRLAVAAKLEIWVLYVDDVAAAAFICPHDGRARYTLKSSFSEGFGTNRSPTLVLMNFMVQQTWGIGASRIDFVGKVPFLDRWATDDLEFETRVYFRSRRALQRERAADGMRAALARLRSLHERAWQRARAAVRPDAAEPLQASQRRVARTLQA